ncbi:outer membrane protein [Erythrobacter sp. W302b]|uniref:outer membrane protein n=1 Tax=Erythrobacter sp. W302b TaxID=3389874 RepID=UPI00396B1195
MMKFAILASAVAAVSLASPALAQEDSTAGGKFVAGAIVGVDSVNTEVDGFSDAEEDLLVGVTIGYDFETETGLLIGAEVEYSDSSVGVSTTDFTIPGDRVSINAGRDLYVGARLGYRTGRNGLLYVKAGYTDASIEGEYDDGTGEISDEISFGGLRIGAGGEIDLSSNYAIRVEYRYSDYGDLEFLGVNTGIGVSRNQGIVTLLGKF